MFQATYISNIKLAMYIMSGWKIFILACIQILKMLSKLI